MKYQTVIVILLLLGVIATLNSQGFLVLIGLKEGYF